MTARARDLERDINRLSLLIAAIPLSAFSLVLYQSHWYWADKLLLLLPLLVLVCLLVMQLKQRVLAVFRASNSVLESITHADAGLRLGPASGVLGEHYRLLNQLAEQISNRRLLSTEQHILLQKVSQHIAVGIIAVDSEQRILLMNPAAELLFQTSFERWRGWPLQQLGVNTELQQAAPRLVPLVIGQQQKQVYVVTEQYLNQGQQQYLIFITDVQQLLYEQERQAWQKLLRVLSHEVNNSLTPICAISQGLSKQLQQPADFDCAQLTEGLQVINERAQRLNVFMRSYQQLSRLPPPDKQPIDLQTLVSAISGLFDDRVSVSGAAVRVFADPTQLQQLLLNLVNNALEATTDPLATPVEIDWQTQGRLLILTVTDHGCGIQNPDNLFVPFYSTKTTGSGIGLVLSRQIARNHGGDLQLLNRQHGPGAQCRLLLPL